MLKVEEYVDSSAYCTLRVGGQFRYFTQITTIEQLKEVGIYAKEKVVPIFVIGGGSNIVFSDGILECLVVKIEIKGSLILEDTIEHTDIKISAGELWDTFVATAVAMNLSGIEALSAIPGTCGATPVQNVGAYGQEVKDTIRSVDVFDCQENTLTTLSNSECQFTYRDSIFKHTAKGKYIITNVTFRLLKKNPSIPNYPDVTKYFIDKKISEPTLSQIREAIIIIRSKKLPNPKDVPNVGSFFKNPIVDPSVAFDLKQKYPTMPIFLIDTNKTKISAGFLIEHAGLKGKDFGPLSVYSHNALVLINTGDASYDDVLFAKKQIQEIVLKMFGITLEPEPEFV